MILLIPKFIFWPNIGDVHLYNNLIYVGSYGDKIPTLFLKTHQYFEHKSQYFFDSYSDRLVIY